MFYNCFSSVSCLLCLSLSSKFFSDLPFTLLAPYAAAAASTRTQNASCVVVDEIDAGDGRYKGTSQKMTIATMISQESKQQRQNRDAGFLLLTTRPRLAIHRHADEDDNPMCVPNQPTQKTE